MARQIFNKIVSIEGCNIFYREAGDKTNPALLLLHGFPSSSVMFKNLMIALSDRFYLIAPDYPGFGFSDFHDRTSFEYSFKNISDHINKFTEEIRLRSFTIYLHDYGCPIGLRLCINHPEKIEALIVQNGNAYEEGLGSQWDEVRDYWEHPTEAKKKKVSAFLSEEGTIMQYTAGLSAEMRTRLSPELPMLDWTFMKRPGNIDMQFELNCDYKTNIGMFPAFQEYFRVYQPPALIIWGKHDEFFSVAEAQCYKRDLNNSEIKIINGAHMVLETNFEEVLALIENFLVAKE